MVPACRGRHSCRQAAGSQAPPLASQLPSCQPHTLRADHGLCAAAMQRYWNDSEMMSRVSQKLNGMQVSSPDTPAPSAPQKLGSKVCGSQLQADPPPGDAAVADNASHRGGRRLT